MERELGIDLPVVTGVTIYVLVPRRQHNVRRDVIGGLTCISFGRDRSQFDAERMRTLFKVRQRVTVPADAAIELAPAAERAACEAEPEVLLELAL